MKRVKVIITSAVVMLAIGGAFASGRSLRVYTTLDDAPPGQVAECQLRGFCSGTGSLCYAAISGNVYQLYYSGCSIPANGILAP